MCCHLFQQPIQRSLPASIRELDLLALKFPPPQILAACRIERLSRGEYRRNTGTNTGTNTGAKTVTVRDPRRVIETNEV